MPRDLLKEFCSMMANRGYLFEAIAELTHVCNLRCMHCYVDQKGSPPELALDQWKEAIDKLVGLGLCMITFTGGEPLLYPGLRELVAHAFKRSCQTRIFTNATMLSHREEVEALKDAGLCYLETSIYGTTADVHDTVTTVPGSFEKTMRAIGWAQELGIPVTVKTSWMKHNWRQYESLVQMFKGMDLYFRGSPSIMPNWVTEDNLSCRLTHEELVAFYRTEARLAPPTENETRPPQAGRKVLDTKPCGIATNNLNLGPDGTLYPCNHLRTPLGNITTDDVAHIWRNAEELTRLRGIVLGDYEVCEGCQYRDHCFICMGDGWMETGNVLKPSNEACMLARARYEAAQPEPQGGVRPGQKERHGQV
jgi:pyrroloquinoline quinone biosynthesis protein E